MTTPVGLGGETLWLCPTLDDTGFNTTTAYNLATSGIGNAVVSSGVWKDTADPGFRHFWIDAAGEVTVAHHADFGLTNDYSFCIWLYAGTWPNNYLIHDKSRYNTPRIMTCATNGTGVYMQHSYPGSTYGTLGRFVLAESTWHHLGYSMEDNGDGTQSVKSYLDGVMFEDKEIASGQFEVNYPFVMSSQTNSPHHGHRCDDIRFYNRVLTPAEFMSLASLRGFQPGMDVEKPNRTRLPARLSSRLRARI